MTPPHHRRGKTFPVPNFLFFSVGARRGGKHALQHPPRTAKSREDGLWHRFHEKPGVLMWTHRRNTTLLFELIRKRFSV